MPARGLATDVCGDQVRRALLEARPAGLTTRQLVAATNLSIHHVHRSIVYIREVSAMAHLTPLIWSYRDGYRFSADPLDWIAYERSCLRTELIRSSRLLSATVAPHAAARPEGEWVNLALASSASCSPRWHCWARQEAELQMRLQRYPSDTSDEEWALIEQAPPPRGLRRDPLHDRQRL